ncbi:MAG: hypothetical protein M1814_001663 [Vezdaea aestivalis]|nr:MAG: hypothetical protein M1814_001663 [Vezdaea aestivalis]
MPSINEKKRKVEEGMRGKPFRPKKRAKKQIQYNSDSSLSNGSEFEATDTESTRDGEEADDSEGSLGHEDDGDDSTSPDLSTTLQHEKFKSQLKKRNDPSVFSTSISKILTGKLPTNQRADPILSRSREAATAATSLASSSLDKKARAEISAQRKAKLENGRIKDVRSADGTRAMGDIQEEEKSLTDVALRGVLKLFNAVSAAQAKAEEAGKQSRAKGLIGRGRKEEKKTELSKEGFMNMINGSKGQGNNVKDLFGGNIEEA